MGVFIEECVLEGVGDSFCGILEDMSYSRLSFFFFYMCGNSFYVYLIYFLNFY